MTDRLSIYNGALALCGERRLAALTEDREPRYLLDDVWNNGGVRYCLEQGQWRFATRSAALDYDTSIVPDFGYRRAFSKNSDWVNTVAVCQDEYFRTPLLQYQDDALYIYADLDTIYVRYVSDGATFGTNYGFWPESFREFVEAHFASKIVFKLTGGEAKAKFLLGNDLTGQRNGILASRRKIAKNKNAQLEPTQFPAQGGWTRAREGKGGRRGPMGDGGTSGSLTG